MVKALEVGAYERMREVDGGFEIPGSKPGVWYNVHLGEDNEWYCSCTGAGYGNYCYHLGAVELKLLRLRLNNPRYSP
jgi:hypothetical protein